MPARPSSPASTRSTVVAGSGRQGVVPAVAEDALRAADGGDGVVAGVLDPDGRSGIRHEKANLFAFDDAERQRIQGFLGFASTALASDRPRALVPIGAPKRDASAFSVPRRRPLSIGAPFAVGFLVAAGLTALFALKQGSAPPTSASPEAGAAVASLADVLAVASVSPSGRSADVDLQTALKLADESLHTTAGGPDHVEASFWLRKSMALAIGSPQMSWTLTQLGTIYAQPSSGPADYGKARLLWELAGASGDAPALCFLGALYEHGLGVARSTRQALGYYQRAKARGGCNDVDAAIARVRN